MSGESDERRFDDEYGRWKDNNRVDARREPSIYGEEIEQEGVNSETELVQWVQSWYEGITARDAQVRMVQNYIDSVTKETVTTEEARDVAERVITEFNSDGD